MDYTEEIDNWEPFHDTFHLRADTVTLYTEKVQDLCSTTLSASNIRHSPIMSRIKSWESAKGSINRRNRERVIRRRIRDLVESQGRRWDDYIHETGFGLYGEETEPFKGPEEMFSALHDFGGVRISLYFPGDIEKVAILISKQFHVIRRVEKGHGSQGSVQSLEERLELLENPGRSTQATADARILQRSMRTFTGYKATHFVVKLQDKHIKDSRKVAWKDIVVEIQVGTLVMHVWSEIEHDMIYKPLDSQDGEVSEDEKRILDLINGIVLTGEAALRQLEASTAQRLNKRAEDENAMASSHYELATWIEKHFNQRKKNFEGTGSEWRHLEQLFIILKVTGTNKHSEVIKLVEDATQRTLSRHYLPTEMLWGLINSSASSEWPPLLNDKASEPDLVHNARLWALRLVHSMNLAIYFGVIEEFLGLYPHGGFGPYTPPDIHHPSITSFLDILHPEQPHYSDKETAWKIIDFCKAIFRIENRIPKETSQMVRVAMNLPMTHLVAGFVEGVSRTIPVPAIITRRLPLEQMNETQMNEAQANSLADINRFSDTIDIIDRYMSSHGRRGDLMVIWDHLREQPMDSTENQSIKNRFFVPLMRCGDASFGLWKLQVIDPFVNIEKMKAEDIGESAKLITKIKQTFEDSDSVLNLAYRLHADQEWDRIREAWKIIKALRRQRASLPQPYTAEGTKRSLQPRSNPGSMNWT